MIINLSRQNSLVSAFVAEIRDLNIQQDRMRFRRNMQRIAEIAAYEISKELEWVDHEIQTPLTTTTVKVLKEQPVIGSILRAGLSMHEGLLNYFDKADNAFISAYRKHDEKGNFVIELEYVSCPDISGRTLIVADPMLATGASMALTLKQLFNLGKVRDIHIVTAIAAKPGLDLIRKMVPEAKIWTGAIDNELNAKSYIVPGLGDAGDLAYGTKMQY